MQNLKIVKECAINRCYVLRNASIKTTELHIFCDASERAHAAVTYFRFVLSNEKSHVSIIMAKSRIAPLKSTTIPRLELQAALLASKIAKIITQEHEFVISRRVFWSDSKTVLQWIRKDPRDFKMFVANRLSEIRENTNISQWRWVPSRENPEDDTTRFIPQGLRKSSRWLLGPSFLLLNETEWPTEISNKVLINNNTELIKSHTILTTITQQEPSIIVFSRFSCRNRLLFALRRVY